LVVGWWRLQKRPEKTLSSLYLHGCLLLDSLLLLSSSSPPPLPLLSPRLTIVNMYGCLAVGDRAVHTLLTAAEDSLQAVVLDGLVKVESREVECREVECRECVGLAAPKLHKVCIKGCATQATLDAP
jgi:hypothetical protein